MASRQVLAAPTGISDPALQDYLSRLVAQMQRAIDDLATAAVVGLDVTNVTPATSFDASTATLAETASALGQAINAFKQRGIVS